MARRALALHDDVAPRVVLGSALLELGQPVEAADTFDEAIQRLGHPEHQLVAKRNGARQEARLRRETIDSLAADSFAAASAFFRRRRHHEVLGRLGFPADDDRVPEDRAP